MKSYLNANNTIPQTVVYYFQTMKALTELFVCPIFLWAGPRQRRCQHCQGDDEEATDDIHFKLCNFYNCITIPSDLQREIKLRLNNCGPLTTNRYD